MTADPSQGNILFLFLAVETLLLLLQTEAMPSSLFRHLVHPIIPSLQLYLTNSYVIH